MVPVDFSLIPFPDAVKQLELANVVDRAFHHYYQSAEDEIASIESMPSVRAAYEQKGPDWRDGVRKKDRPMRYVRYYAGDALISGDVDLDQLFYRTNIAGLVVDGDLTISGSVLNWEIDTTASFVEVHGNLHCQNIIVGCADMVVRGDARVSNVVVSTYNHGRLEIAGDVFAKYFIVDDHWTLVGRAVHGYGWKNSSSAEVELPASDWIGELRPEFQAEFFENNGDVKCPNGNVDLVMALLDERAILKG
jgi:hypothetical protein